QPRGIICRQVITTRLLHARQRVQSRPIQDLQRGFVHALRQSLKKSVATQVGEQQKALAQVLGEYLRHVQAGLGQAPGYMYERAAVLALGWRVHDNDGAVVGVEAEVAPETGIAGCGSQGVRHQAQMWWQTCQPIMQQRQTGVWLREVSGFHVLGHSLTIIPARLFLKEGIASTGPAVVPKYNPFFEGETFVRS